MISTIQHLDDTILNLIQNGMHFLLLDKIMIAFSWLGDKGMIWIIIAILFMCSKNHKHTGYVMAVALILCVVTGNIILKPLVARMRPCFINPEVSLLIACPTDFSFPSGHTMSSFAAAQAIFMSNKRWGKWAFIVASLIGYSRLYLYVHYPSDILGGIIFGVIMALTAYKILELTKNNSKAENKM